VNEPLELVEPLVERWALAPPAADRLAALLAALAGDPAAPTSVRRLDEAAETHVADSLVALELGPVRAARRIADLGSGPGFPGLALAVALPDARVALVESAARKSAFLERAIAAAGLANAEVVHARAEAWPEGAEAHDLVTARALAALPVVVEYAAPLLALDGALVAWRGRRDSGAEAAAARAAAEVGLEPVEVRHVHPYPGARDRHLHVFRKAAPTPPRFPRRPGMARKRPLGAD
jgi:16S rRNA (guanine527-N7)-methyltransferase